MENNYDLKVKWATFGTDTKHGDDTGYNSGYGTKLRDWLHLFGIDCDHSDDEVMTAEEHAAYTTWYGDQEVKIATSIFGEDAIYGSGLVNADDDAMLELQKTLAGKIGLSAECATMGLDTKEYVTVSSSNKTAVTSKWYGDNDNPFVASGYKFQCTWWAYSRASEYLGHWVSTSCFRGDAGTWFGEASSAGYSSGQEPRAGAIACWSGGGSRGAGHVAFVEGVSEDGTIYLSHAGSGTYWFGITKHTSLEEMKKWRTGTFQGFIYL